MKYLIKISSSYSSIFPFILLSSFTLHCPCTSFSLSVPGICLLRLMAAGMPGRCHAAGATGTSFDSGISSQPASDCADSLKWLCTERGHHFLNLLFSSCLFFSLFLPCFLCLPSAFPPENCCGGERVQAGLAGCERFPQRGLVGGGEVRIVFFFLSKHLKKQPSQ